MFKAIFIPEDSSAIQERLLDSSGGLEKDRYFLLNVNWNEKVFISLSLSLRIASESYFSVLSKREREEINSRALEEVDEAIKRQQLQPSSISPNLLQNLSSQSSVEIISLSLPTPVNNFQGVSMYCDRNGKVKKLGLNSRATSIAKSCNHELEVFGDVFIGRCHDDESLPWKRLDFGLDDLNSEAPWLRQAQEANKGKSMNKYNTSGTLQNILSQQSSSAPTAALPLKSTESDCGYKHDGNSQWSQTVDEVEWRITLAEWVKKSDISVIIKSNSVKLVVKSPSSSGTSIFKNPDELSSPDRQILLDASGAILFSTVDVDSSTWTLEKAVGSIDLVISLSKQETNTWKTLLRNSA